MFNKRADSNKHSWQGCENVANEIEGLDNVLQAITKIGDTDKLREALGQACSLVERAAKETAPKDTGELRRSITSKVEEDEESLKGIVYTPLEYAPYVEYGTGLFAENGDGRQDVPWYYLDDEGALRKTSGQKPHPFLRPALNENTEDILRVLQGGLRKND